MRQAGGEKVVHHAYEYAQMAQGHTSWSYHVTLAYIGLQSPAISRQDRLQHPHRGQKKKRKRKENPPLHAGPYRQWSWGKCPLCPLNKEALDVSLKLYLP